MRFTATISIDVEDPEEMLEAARNWVHAERGTPPADAGSTFAELLTELFDLGITSEAIAYYGHGALFAEALAKAAGSPTTVTVSVDGATTRPYRVGE